MKEETFYQIADFFDENVENITESWYPTVEELQTRVDEDNIESFYPLFIYFASDPLAKVDSEVCHEAEYRETVKYAQKIVERIELE